MKQSEQGTLRYLRQVSGKTRYIVYFLAFLQMGAGLVDLASAWVLRDLIDSATAKEWAAFKWAAVLFVGVLVIRLAIRAFIRYLEERGKSGLENAFKARLLSDLMGKDYGSVAATHSGEWMNRLTSDTRIVSEHMISILPGALSMLVRMVGALVMLSVLEPRFVAILVPAGILLIIVTFLFRRIMKKLHKAIQEADGALRVFLQETLGSLLVVKAFNREEAAEERAEGLMEAHKKARMRRNWFSNFSNVGFGLVMGGAYTLAGIYCAYSIYVGRISYGTMTAILQLVNQIQNPVANISGYVPKYYAMVASAERLMEVSSCTEETYEGMHSAEDARAFYDSEFRGFGFRNMSFSYDVEEPEDGRLTTMTVSDCNLFIEKGEYVGIVGASGCGKSTMMKLMMAFYPLSSGERYILSTSRGELPLDAGWRSLFAYVPQGNNLMTGTIRDAVSFGVESTDDTIWRALHAACADEFVSTFPDGLGTQLGERGAGLSEGQLQRLAIARAVYADRPILLLDECTSSLDEDTERMVLSRLREMTDRTVLIITHRKAALNIVDSVISCQETEDALETSSNGPHLIWEKKRS